MIDKTLNTIRPLIPHRLFTLLQPIYHYMLAMLATLLCWFPSRKIVVIGVTGTKGKSTTTELINAILEEAGYKTAVSNTIRYKICDNSTPNKFKMSMPGRFFTQRLMRKARNTGCTHFILEMTSQGVLQYRHKFINLDALVFTNLSPEHIESHGSYEKYVEAKVEIGQELSRSRKRPRILIVNGDDRESEKFLSIDVEIKKKFNIRDAVETPLLGDFNKYNIAGAVVLARALGINEEIIKKAIKNFASIPGRVQFIEEGQNFQVVVDYAHTADSLEKIYKLFPEKRKICVLGGTGGGRDRAKREEMGKLADRYCDHIILTDEDPYDEDPSQIISDIEKGIVNKKPKIIMDRRSAIKEAIAVAKENDVILITGKGTDPYIMGPDGSKTPWSDADVVKELLS